MEAIGLKKAVLVVLVSASLLVLVACGNGTEKQENTKEAKQEVVKKEKNKGMKKNNQNKSKKEESSASSEIVKQENNDSSIAKNAVNSDSESDAIIQEKVESSSSSTGSNEQNTQVDLSNEQGNQLVVPNEQAAIELLKEQLQPDSEDTVFAILGPIKHDLAGDYYLVKLRSLELSKGGGSGTIGLYKVYQDGHFTENEAAIPNDQEAIKLLKEQLKTDNNDVGFAVLGPLKEDEEGRYYLIKLRSASLAQNGGSGTIGLYKVYQDGHFRENN